ncbi:MAG: GUN4 domain-containing protein [Microcystis aeruginosa PMC 728.11]|nr:GUN4 domain-containing protein [Microcystis aeruginosa PMC 728.11]
MKILHISLTPQGSDYVSLRYFWDNPNQYEERRLPLAEIKDLGNQAETNYYTRIPVDYAITGQKLYHWLDGNNRLLANALKESQQQGLIIAIAADKGLAHLPWELLHDGQCFLVEKQPPIIPIRWVSNSQSIVIVTQPKNRALNVLFMATSPLDVEPELDYEAEEGQILEATKRTPANLRVEESGCLTELSYVVGEYEKNYFDIFHLTGHATHQNKKPCFLTEDEYGGLVYSNTSEIATALRYPLPPLIFLSGCRTGYASDGAVPSMAEELLNLGATAVLGWGQNVRDTDATAAASSLYWRLSQGETVANAIASTYQSLIKQNARDWHKLRLYVGHTLPQALVTPLRTKGRKQLPKPTTTLEFRDDENRLRVASREEFVGRRRQLQNCLRTLKTDYNKVGVLIHGMGGWGKSSIASRLWDRLSDYEKILWWRQIDESNLIKKLSSKLIKPELREIRNILASNNDCLEVKLTYLFSQLAELGEKPFLLILDDFEWNLEPREGGYILKPEVAPILEALVRSIQETGTENRIIITCRYDFDSDLLDYFYKQGLEPFRKAELTKKLNRLKNFNSDKISENVRERALNLADGNPRLLEFLNNEVLGKQDGETKLTELEESPELWKDKIIWEELYQLIDEPLQQVLSHCLVYEIPVPMIALEVVCELLPDYKRQLKRGLRWGLIEVGSEHKEKDRVYRVSRILPHVISSIRLPEAPDVYDLYGKAYEELNKLWGNEKNRSQEKWREIFRLLFADQENSQRFRQGFYKILEMILQHAGNQGKGILDRGYVVEMKYIGKDPRFPIPGVVFQQMEVVQDREELDEVYVDELRKIQEKLSTENLCQQLSKYLKKGDWRKADEETAFIWYQLIVLNNEHNFYTLAANFPKDILKEMDALWIKYSKGKFGFSIQKKIYLDLSGGEYHYSDEIWFDNFCEYVGWKSLYYHQLTFNYQNSPLGNLPCLWASLHDITIMNERIMLSNTAGGEMAGICLIRLFNKL